MIFDIVNAATVAIEMYFCDYLHSLCNVINPPPSEPGSPNRRLRFHPYTMNTIIV